MESNPQAKQCKNNLQKTVNIFSNLLRKAQEKLQDTIEQHITIITNQHQIQLTKKDTQYTKNQKITTVHHLENLFSIILLKNSEKFLHSFQIRIYEIHFRLLNYIFIRIQFSAFWNSLLLSTKRIFQAKHSQDCSLLQKLLFLLKLLEIFTRPLHSMKIRDYLPTFSTSMSKSDTTIKNHST